MKKQLNTTFIGKKVHYYATLTSTMETAKKLAREEAPEGTVIIADKQTSGRGRMGRAWLSPEGNLAISVILRPSMNDLPQLIMIGSVAVVRAVKSTTGLNAQIKWPNDILIEGKKVCGILIESEIKGNKINFTTIGMGINVNLNPTDFPEISSLATSLSHELGKIISRNELCHAILSELEKLYLEVKAGVSVSYEWRSNMETLGKLIQVKTGKSFEEGIAEAVTENGNLILRRTDGSIAEITVGDVTVIKA